MVKSPFNCVISPLNQLQVANQKDCLLYCVKHDRPIIIFILEPVEGEIKIYPKNINVLYYIKLKRKKFYTKKL